IGEKAIAWEVHDLIKELLRGVLAFVRRVGGAAVTVNEGDVCRMHMSKRLPAAVEHIQRPLLLQGGADEFVCAAFPATVAEHRASIATAAGMRRDASTGMRPAREKHGWRFSADIAGVVVVAGVRIAAVGCRAVKIGALLHIAGIVGE